MLSPRQHDLCNDTQCWRWQCIRSSRQGLSPLQPSVLLPSVLHHLYCLKWGEGERTNSQKLKNICRESKGQHMHTLTQRRRVLCYLYIHIYIIRNDRIYITVLKRWESLWKPVSATEKKEDFFTELRVSAIDLQSKTAFPFLRMNFKLKGFLMSNFPVLFHYANDPRPPGSADDSNRAGSSFRALSHRYRHGDLLVTQSW